jgi:predicted aspartyl protease
MRRFSGKLGPRGAFVTVEVHPSNAFLLASPSIGRGVPLVTTSRALLDTGADASAIDSRIIRDLDLRATGAYNVRTASSQAVTADTYDVTVAIGGGRRLAEYPLEVLAIDLSGHGVDAILGWDLLSLCVLRCDGPKGRFSLGY